ASSGGSRLGYWREVLDGAGESLPVLLLGHGPQSFRAVHVPRYAAVEADLGEVGQFPDSCHNLLLDLLNDTGVLGVLAWLAVLATAAALAARALRRSASRGAQLVSVAVLAGL